MCHELDSAPPIPALRGAAVSHDDLALESSDGTRFAAFLASPDEPAGNGVVILPDVRGLYRFYEELALRFAETGVDALAIDYFGRTAGTGPRGADFEFMPHVQQTRYPQLLADIRAAADHLRAERRTRALFSVGFCYGGRLAYMTATRHELELAGVVGFYGVPVGPGRAEMPAPAELAPEMRCPVLGLFGGDDPGIPAESIEAFEQALAEAGVEHDVVTYPGAPHSFFDRRAELFAPESADAWRRLLDFVQSRAAASSR
jgi:carboxymethylenebutenolidase